MTRTVICRKYGEELPALNAPPFPGPRGQEIFERVSSKAWKEWLAMQTMLINEKRLNVRDPETRAYLQGQMERFLDNEPTDHVEGYVPPPATP